MVQSHALTALVSLRLSALHLVFPKLPGSIQAWTVWKATAETVSSNEKRWAGGDAGDLEAGYELSAEVKFHTLIHSLFTPWEVNLSRSEGNKPLICSHTPHTHSHLPCWLLFTLLTHSHFPFAHLGLYSHSLFASVSCLYILSVTDVYHLMLQQNALLVMAHIPILRIM